MSAQAQQADRKGGNKIPIYSGYSCARCGSSETGRNLVVCLDGTSNKFSVNNTSIVELYRHLHSDTTQFTYYNSGIGTSAPRHSFISLRYLAQLFHNAVDLAFARKLEKIVLAAYRWLSENYQKGDRIYLFGFSRGAYQVRVLSAMIDKVGLIRRGNEEQIPFAFQFYADLSHSKTVEDSESKSDKDPEVTAKKHKAVSGKPQPGGKGPDLAPSSPHELAKAFKQTFSRDSVRVHFVGAWDTVSSIGLGRQTLHESSADGMNHVCFFRHALALDERRVKFLPEYAHGGTTLPPPTLEKGSSKDKRQDGPCEHPHTKEVWFRGSHSDIGGGNVENLSLDRGNPPLRWMSYEATQAGLRMISFEASRFHNWEDFNPKPSLQGAWWLLEVLPIRRLSFRDHKHTTFMPHLARERKIKPGQFIHSTVAPQKSDDKYIPRASLPQELGGWDAYFGEIQPDKVSEDDKVSEHDEVSVAVEQDLRNVLELLVKGLEETWSDDRLRQFESALKSVEHSRALYDLLEFFKSTESKSVGSQGELSREEKTQDLFFKAFDVVIRKIIHKSSQHHPPAVSLSLEKDVRLYALCVRLFGLTQHAPVRVSAVHVKSDKPESDKQNSQAQEADVHISITNQDLQIMFRGPEFLKTDEGNIAYTCALDDHKTVFAMLRRASYFFANLHWKPTETKSYEVRLADYHGSFSEPCNDVFFINRGSYSCQISEVDAKYKYVFVLRFHPDLSIESYPVVANFHRKLRPVSFELPNQCLHPWNQQRCTSVYKVILTTEYPPELANIFQEGIEPGEAGSKFNEWRPEKREIPYATIADILSSGLDWTETVFSVVQEGTQPQDSFHYYDLEQHPSGPSSPSMKQGGTDYPSLTRISGDEKQSAPWKPRDPKSNMNLPRVSVARTSIPIWDVGDTATTASEAAGMAVSPLTPTKTSSEIKNAQKKSVHDWMKRTIPDSEPVEVVHSPHNPTSVSSDSGVSDSDGYHDRILPNSYALSESPQRMSKPLPGEPPIGDDIRQHAVSVVSTAAGAEAAGATPGPLDIITISRHDRASVPTTPRSPSDINSPMTDSDRSPSGFASEDLGSPTTGGARSPVTVRGQSSETADASLGRDATRETGAVGGPPDRSGSDSQEDTANDNVAVPLGLEHINEVSSMAPADSNTSNGTVREPVHRSSIFDGLVRSFFGQRTT